jgi:guanine deaminase
MVIASYGGAGARLSPRDLYVSAMTGAIEMLTTGTTSVLDCARSDLEWFDDGMAAIMQAYADIGMRAGVAAQYADLDFFSSLPMKLIGEEASRPARARPEDILAPAQGFVRNWRGKHERLKPMLGPSSLPRCSVELFEASIDLARSEGVHLQSHLLSAKSQVPVALDRYGGSTVDFLKRIGGLQPWTSFAHAIWLSPQEIELFAASDAVAIHNPVSNLKLGAGVAAAPAMRHAGVKVALGSDGASSGDSQNMFETVKAAAVVHRVANPPELWPTALGALEMCWRGGAAALGAPVGELAPGYRADLTLLHTRSLFIEPRQQMANQIVYSELGSSVDTVLVDGRVVVENGRVVTVDTDALHAEAQEIVNRICATLPDRLRRFEELRPMLDRLEATVGHLPLEFSRTCCY